MTGVAQVTTKRASAKYNDLSVPSAYCLVPSYLLPYPFTRFILAPTSLSFSSSRS